MNSAILKKVFWAGIILVLVLLIGSVGYWLVTGRQHSALDVLYMTFITITTIGFGEVLDLSAYPAGRLFTILIAVSGIGLIAYIATNATALLVEGELTKSFRSRKMEKAARNSNEHYVICGFGPIGNHIADELDSTGRGYVIVEKDKERVDEILEKRKDKTVIQGDATEEDTLMKTGILNAWGLFAVTSDDNQNLVISLTAKQLNPGLRVVAQCNETQNIAKIHKAGADSVVSPQQIGGLRMASEMVRPTVVSFLDIMMHDREMNLRVEEIPVPESYAGKTIRSLELKEHPSALLLAVKTGDSWMYNPSDSYTVSQRDTLIFMVTAEAKRELEEFLKSR